MSNLPASSYLILTLAIGYSFIYPAFNDISLLADEKQRFEESLEMVMNIEDKKNALLSEFEKISESDKKNIEAILPDSLNYVKLVSDIDAVASSHGISIDKISQKMSDNSVEIQEEGAYIPKTYKSSIIGFSFTSSYEKFNDFMDDLEKSLRILDIRSLQISTGEGKVYSYDIEFEVYWFE